MSKKQWGHGFYAGYKKAKIEECDKDEKNGVELNESGELICANRYCKSPYLHHFLVETFDRDKEDSCKGTKVTIDEGLVNIINSSDAMIGNPSARRDGVRIFFWCEHCRAISVLELAQHKGSSLLELKVALESAPLTHAALSRRAP